MATTPPRRGTSARARTGRLDDLLRRAGTKRSGRRSYRRRQGGLLSTTIGAVRDENGRATRSTLQDTMRTLALGSARRTRGQAVVELAVILPILLVLLASAADLGRVFYSSVVVENAARAGALEASRNPTSFVPGGPCDVYTNRVLCAVQRESSPVVDIAVTDVAVACTPDPCADDLGNTVTVTVQGHFGLITPFLASFFPGGQITVASTATAQIAVEPIVSAASPSPSPSPSPTPTPSPSPSVGPSPSPSPSPSVSPAPSPSPSVPVSPSPSPLCFPPTSDFTFSPAFGKKKKTEFQFTDLSTTTPECPLTWSWNFGDGAGASSTSTLQDPTHTYDAQGTYTITLVVSNMGGSDSRSRTVTVTQ
jgi:Flp pilus assembly protein TadG